MKEFPQNFSFDSVRSEAKQANLELLDNQTYLNSNQIKSCMLAWFCFNAEFYRGNNYWFIRGDIDNNQKNIDFLTNYFPQENITFKTKTISYKGSIFYQEILTNFVSEIETILKKSHSNLPIAS